MTNSNSNSNFSQHRFFRVAEIGELWLFCGRLATITEVNVHGHAVTLEVEDSGGVVRPFRINNTAFLQPLAGAGETVLDALNRATKQINAAQRAAEVWLANPRVGDVFETPGGVLFAIAELSSGGPITVKRSSYRGPDLGVVKASHTYQNVTSLRHAYRFHAHPGYWVRAHSTLRPEFQEEFAPRSDRI